MYSVNLFKTIKIDIFGLKQGFYMYVQINKSIQKIYTFTHTCIWKKMNIQLLVLMNMQILGCLGAIVQLFMC